MDGVIVVDKPSGWTSHDVVAKVKRTLKAKKVGHLGTLDPAATGVLPLVVDGATKFARFLDVGGKGYAAVMKLGEETDTQDAEGEVLKTSEVGSIERAEIEDTLGSFVGTIEQTPPMYSSVKQGGVPLYKLARKGVTVERAAKEVDIYSIAVSRVELPFVDFSVECSRGTYIRTLSVDAGAKLGAGAHLYRLRRTRSGTFTEAEAVDVQGSKEELEAALIPLEAALVRSSALIKGIELDDSAASKVARGPFRAETSESFKPGEVVRLMHGVVVLAFAEYVSTGEPSGSSEFNVVKVLYGGAVRSSNEGSAVKSGRASGA
ncbi:MAG: tRNA pseudouridine(55) synthase TruB [Proteobacteria bacterium]|nr:tRNA pseudouridine(55) synthase TruB [Pseudomonadota bacterium]